ncbi:ATP-binding cassette domain-containing protein, partial [Staphylococcus sp. EG-SA-1]|uniref:ATP-binding cassette domain-containing protein n=1 Tax=Staphylococcus sp. EG-SA-1 TaxID=2767484 RepID=UPI001F11BA50
MADEKAGVSARVVTLQDPPYPDNFDFTTLDKSFRENYGTLGPIGATIAIIGESGSGKSTLSRMILGIEKPDKGCVTLNDQPM